MLLYQACYNLNQINVLILTTICTNENLTMAEKRLVLLLFYSLFDVFTFVICCTDAFVTHGTKDLGCRVNTSMRATSNFIIRLHQTNSIGLNSEDLFGRDTTAIRWLSQSHCLSPLFSPLLLQHYWEPKRHINKAIVWQWLPLLSQKSSSHQAWQMAMVESSCWFCKNLLLNTCCKNPYWP